MRPVDKGSVPEEDGKEVVFKKYNQAKGYLIERLGRYCSYCENSINANLALEHVLPKEHYPEKELD